MTLINRRALVLQYGVSIRLINRLVPMFQVVKTAAIYQRMSDSNDVIVTKVTHLFLEVKPKPYDNVFTDSMDKIQLD
jgi:hypothetical protein